MSSDTGRSWSVTPVIQTGCWCSTFTAHRVLVSTGASLKRRSRRWVPVSSASTDRGMDALFGTDAAVLDDPMLRHHLFVTMTEGLRQAFSGVGWDNVSWVGPWDIDLEAVTCPVHLWYGEDDRSLPIAHAAWLAGHLRHTNLVVRPGEGHLGAMRHWQQMLRTLTTHSTTM